MNIPKINFPDFSKILKIPKIEQLDLDMSDYFKNEAERKSQPFHTNYLLEDLLKSQTSKWVNYLMLILVALTLGISIWTLLLFYKIN